MAFTEVSYETMRVMLEEYCQIKHRFSKLSAYGCALYVLRGEGQSYKFVYERDALTEQELIDYVNRSDALSEAANYNIYVIIPVKMNCIGQIHSGNNDITKSFECHLEICKILLPSTTHNLRKPIEVDRVFALVNQETCILEAHATDKAPEGWEQQGTFRIKWKNS